MLLPLRLFLYYLAVLNTAALCVCGWDKLCAVRRRWRIPERTLLLLAAAGGGVGLLAGMLLFRHKISKPLFYLGVPAILAGQILLAWLFRHFA